MGWATIGSFSDARDIQRQLKQQHLSQAQVNELNRAPVTFQTVTAPAQEEYDSYQQTFFTQSNAAKLDTLNLHWSDLPTFRIEELREEESFEVFLAHFCRILGANIGSDPNEEVSFENNLYIKALELEALAGVEYLEDVFTLSLELSSNYENLPEGFKTFIDGIPVNHAFNIQYDLPELPEPLPEEPEGRPIPQDMHTIIDALEAVDLTPGEVRLRQIAAAIMVLDGQVPEMLHELSEAGSGNESPRRTLAILSSLAEHNWDGNIGDEVLSILDSQEVRDLLTPIAATLVDNIASISVVDREAVNSRNPVVETSFVDLIRQLQSLKETMYQDYPLQS